MRLDEVEIRRASRVYSAERHHVGHVDGFLVDRDAHIMHVVLERGHLSDRREVTIPIGAVAKVETDDVTLSLTKDHVGALPEMAVPRRPAVERARTTTTASVPPPKNATAVARQRPDSHSRQRRRAAWQRLGSDARQSPLDNSSEGRSNGWDGKRGRRRLRGAEQGLPGADGAQAV